MNGEKRYRAPWDMANKLVTVVLLAIMLAVAAGCFAGDFVKTFPYSHAFGLLLLAIIAVTWCMSPKEYVLTPKELTVRTRCGARRFSRADFTTFEKVNRKDLGFTLRLFASGAFFGYFGLYYANRIGGFHCWCTRLNDLALIRRRNGWPLLVSPEPLREFLNALDEKP